MVTQGACLAALPIGFDLLAFQTAGSPATPKGKNKELRQMELGKFCTVFHSVC